MTPTSEEERAVSLVPAPAAWFALIVLVVAAMGYTMFKSPAWWSIPEDPTNWDASQFVLHGHIDKVYSHTTGLVSFPGFVLLSLPIAALSNLLHLGTLSTGTGHSLRPTAWLLWGPWVSMAAGSIIVTIDSAAAYLRISKGRRTALAVVQAVLVWQLIVLWGHPEDVVAVSVFIWAWLASEKGHWGLAGWLMGAAVAIQPVVLLLLPLQFILCPAGRRLLFLVRSAVVSVVLLLPELIASFGPTWRQLVQQPNYPTLDHPTPLLFLAPHLPSIGNTETVAAGPARIISVGLCCMVAYVVFRHPQPPIRLMWCFALCFAFRSLVESVMDPYYIWPALALAILVASKQRVLYFVLAALMATLMTGYAQSFHRPWVWWGGLVAGMAVVLAASFPDWHSDSLSPPADERQPAGLQLAEPSAGH